MESNALVPMNEIKEMAAAVCKSGLFQLPSPEAALTLMLICQSEGIHPIQAVKRYHIIKGRPAMRADAMLAEFQRLGGRVQWKERSDTKVTAIFSHPQGEAEITWTIDMAKSAGLTANDTWRKYPRQMLTARCISEGIRTVLPAVVTGIYTPEEVADFDLPAEKAPAKSAKKAEKSAEVPAKAEKPAEIEAETIEVVPVVHAPTVEPSLVERCIGEAKPEPEFVPGEIIPESVPEVKAAERPSITGLNVDLSAKNAGQIADEIKKIRVMAQNYGCKSTEDFAQLMQIAVGREVTTAVSLNDDERTRAIEFLSAALQGG